MKLVFVISGIKFDQSVEPAWFCRHSETPGNMDRH